MWKLFVTSPFWGVGAYWLYLNPKYISWGFWTVGSLFGLFVLLKILVWALRRRFLKREKERKTPEVWGKIPKAYTPQAVMPTFVQMPTAYPMQQQQQYQPRWVDLPEGRYEVE